MMKKIVIALVLFALCLAPAFTQSITEVKAVPEEKAVITEFEKYGHALLDLSIEKIMADGYELGDTVDLKFSNGYELNGIPFFNGYYVAKGEPLLRAYPGHTYVAACVNYGKIYEIAGLSLGDTVTIRLNTKGGALDTQVLNSLKYTDKREDYASDVVFANFREVTTGSIAPGKLFRSCSPVSNEHGRASFADALIEGVGVRSVLNLADSDEEILSYIALENYNSPYYKSLYESGRVIALSMPIDFSSDSFATKLAGGLKQLVEIKPETPILVHCTEGKDRAGFVTALFEALMGASKDEIIEDYMLSYNNYYGITKEHTQRYDVIVKNNIAEMLKAIEGNSADLYKGARAFLVNHGMTDGEVDALISALK